MSDYDPPLPPPPTGFPVVIGDRSVFDKYASRPWVEVLAAADLGADGLRRDAFGSATAMPVAGQFMLRQMALPCSPQLRALAALMKQAW